jgi:hypothetical protein
MTLCGAYRVDCRDGSFFNINTRVRSFSLIGPAVAAV